MKVLLFNGSAKLEGCTFTALTEVAKVLKEENIECEIVQLGGQPVRDCIGCNRCSELDNECIFKDDMINGLIKKAENADGFVFGTPVYYAHPSGRLLSVMDRLFYAGGDAFRHKPAAAISSARRAGTTASIDVLNKYFTISEMPVVSSTYWNMVHGHTADDVLKDLEGLQTMRNIGRNMAWLLKCINLGKEHGVKVPETERSFVTNFIR